MSSHQNFIDKFLNTSKKHTMKKEGLKRQEINGDQMTIIDAKEKVVITINELKEEYPAHVRQRKNVYNYLNKKLNLNVRVYDYDETGENTILSLDPNGERQAEYNYIIEKFSAALLNKR